VQIEAMLASISAPVSSVRLSYLGWLAYRRSLR